jgi:hypothetical protein
MSESATTERASAQGENTLFLASSQPKADAGSVVIFLVSFILSMGGIYLMSLAFGVGDAGFWVFAAGLAATAIGFWTCFGMVANRR